MAKYATPNETTKIMAAFNSIPANAVIVDTPVLSVKCIEESI